MAGLRDIVVKPEYRPCMVSKRKALFHRWANAATTIGDSALIGGYKAGQIWKVLGIVEYEDGTVHLVYPSDIRFVDHPMEEYAWPDMADS